MFIGAESEMEVVFTEKSCTVGFDTAPAFGLKLERGDVVVTTDA